MNNKVGFACDIKMWCPASGNGPAGAAHDQLQTDECTRACSVW